ncbi:MAG: MIP/aquaporin family protein [Leeuwenhoekiella sp.]
MVSKREFLGEFLGTFVMVLFGIGSVAVTILFDGYQSIFQIALAWGIAVMLAIYLTRHLSNAHLNPAVTLGMIASGRMPVKKLVLYVSAQLLGAILSGLTLYLLFHPSITAYEIAHNITRGTPDSIATARMFGEFYQIPGGAAVVSMPLAMFAEGLGTFILLLFIFALTDGANVGRPHDNIAPVFIGITVSIIITLVAPLTQAGINPARDFGPRLVAWVFGWGDAAFPDRSFGFFFVYILAPCIGGVLAALFFSKVLDPVMRYKSSSEL